MAAYYPMPFAMKPTQGQQHYEQALAKEKSPEKSLEEKSLEKCLKDALRIMRLERILDTVLGRFNEETALIAELGDQLARSPTASLTAKRFSQLLEESASASGLIKATTNVFFIVPQT